MSCNNVQEFRGENTTRTSTEELAYNLNKVTTTKTDSLTASIAQGILAVKDPRAFACGVELTIEGDYTEDNAFIDGFIAVPK